MNITTLLVPAGIAALIGLRLYLGIHAGKTLDQLPPEVHAWLRSHRHVMD